jgi:hypothetical protein
MQPIVVRYRRRDTTWMVTVSGHGRELAATASRIIEARELANEFVAEISSELEIKPIVVHLLDGSAVEFTRAYIAARLFDTTPMKISDATPNANKHDTNGDHPDAGPTDAPKREV